MRIWTEAAKIAQREAIKRWQPWAHSTGPRTAQGKQRSATNARKFDRVSIKEQRTLHAALTAQRQGLKAAKAIFYWKIRKIVKNELLCSPILTAFLWLQTARFAGFSSTGVTSVSEMPRINRLSHLPLRSKT